MLTRAVAVEVDSISPAVSAKILTEGNRGSASGLYFFSSAMIVETCAG